MDTQTAVRWKLHLELLALTAMIVAAGVVIFVAWEARGGRDDGGQEIRASVPPIPSEAVSLLGAPAQGSPSAKVCLVVFSDFQCPFCARFASETLPEIERAFVATGKIRLVFRHLPLTRIHPFAAKAAEAAWCADRQGRFRAMHDELFRAFARGGEPDLLQLATKAGLKPDPFGSCLDSGEATPQVRADIAVAKGLGVTGTPAFLIGTSLPDGTLKATTWITGSRPFTHFQEALELAIKAVQ